MIARKVLIAAAICSNIAVVVDSFHRHAWPSSLQTKAFIAGDRPAPSLANTVKFGDRKTTSLSLQKESKASQQQQESTSGKPQPVFISPLEVFTPAQLDTSSVGLVLAGQGLIAGLGVAAYSLFGINTELSFDPASMLVAVQVAIPLIVAGFIFDNAPNEELQSVARDTRIYTLRLLGAKTNPVVGAAASGLLSASAGFSEELLFRGAFFSLLAGNPFLGGILPATLITSAVFGLLHYPRFGASAFIEAVLGGAFAFSFIYSGGNLAVPIAVHTMYDFATIFVTWLLAAKDLGKRLVEAEEAARGKLKQYAKSSPPELERVVSAIFGLLDVNRDGSINLRELDAGLKFFGLSNLIWKDTKDSTALFNRLDKDGDGLISLQEFTDGVRSDLVAQMD